jgi:hypothetical protein
MYDNFFEFMSKYKNPMPYAEKYRVLNYLRNLDKVGNMKRGIELKQEEYTKRKKWGPLFVINKVNKHLKSGKDIVEAMFRANLINSRERQVFEKSRTFSEATEQILDLQSKKSKSIMGFMLLLIPIGAILVLLLTTREMVNKVLTDMMKPIVAAGATPPPLPVYMESPLMYGLGNIAFFGGLLVVFLFMRYNKKHSPKVYFKTIPIFEEEYSFNIIHSLKSMLKSGTSLSDSAKILLDGEDDNIKKKIYGEIVESTKKGVVSLADIFENNGINYSTVSLIKMGEDSGRMEEALNSAYNEIETRYNRDIKIFNTACMWGGQLGMIFISMKPMIDIMLLTSVGQLNFQLK